MTEKHRSDKRWLVEASYRTEDGRRFDQHFIEELSDLDSIIELGPNWNALIDCKIAFGTGEASEKA